MTMQGNLPTGSSLYFIHEPTKIFIDRIEVTSGLRAFTIKAMTAPYLDANTKRAYILTLADSFYQTNGTIGFTIYATLGAKITDQAQNIYYVVNYAMYQNTYIHESSNPYNFSQMPSTFSFTARDWTALPQGYLPTFNVIPGVANVDSIIYISLPTLTFLQPDFPGEYNYVIELLIEGVTQSPNVAACTVVATQTILPAVPPTVCDTQPVANQPTKITLEMPIEGF
jgi:hypothetical protein